MPSEPRRRALAPTLGLLLGVVACAGAPSEPTPAKPAAAPPLAEAPLLRSEPEPTPEQACDAGDGRVCLMLAGNPPPGGDRVSYLRKTCESGSMVSREGCVRLAQALASDDPTGSRAAYAAACRETDIDSCLQLAEVYERGELVERDLELAGRYYEAGCRMKSAYGCNRLVELVLAGEFESTFTDRYDLIDWACEVGSGIACYEQAQVFIAGGEGFEPDPELARHLLDRACTHGSARGCTLFARELEREPYATRETVRLERMYADACEDGVREACAGARRMAKERQRKIDEGLLIEKLKLDPICVYPPF